MLIQLIIAFNLGLFSSLHCIGMCGGILSAMLLTTNDRENDLKKGLGRNIGYNLGRIISYTIAGLLIGLISAQLTGVFQIPYGHIVLQCIAALVLIGLALNILGKLPFKNYLEHFGVVIWKQIEPLGRSLFPVDSFSKAILFGMVWGWLPCGLVYSALLLSLSSGSAIEGMFTMLLFGLGTLPSMCSIGYFSDYLNRMKSINSIKTITAVLMIFIAVSLPFSSYYFSGHHDHSMETGIKHSHHSH